ncbi:hypothetical protein K490DRAFT_62104 [Saccharata proteae CBS 121410]|uniref:DUF7707 domain-containing protein n=1 Tax=Saccharata proteae CBS 121410 TaxID=1314787 RepID=A0A9P4LZ80_9PEZI|nr:hypothetical protein K490DRAFT_62104 [Saccharata proteae CBS 121410]
MHFTALFAAASAIAGLAAAQSSTSSSSIAYSTVDPNSVDSATRNTWCRAQEQTCPTLCGGSTLANTCDISTLTYNCTCASNVGSLNVSDFTQTLPSLECQYAVGQCTADHPDDAEGQAACQSISCGSKNVTSQVVSSSSSAAASTTATASSSGSATSGSAAAATTTQAGGAQALNYGMNYGSATLLGGLVALFGFAL